MGFDVIIRALKPLCLKRGSHRYVRSLVVGTIVSVTSIFVWSFVHLNVAVRTGEVPWYTIDLFIVLTGALQAVASPFLSWVGFKRRRTIMMTSTIVLAVVSALVLALPSTKLEDDPEESYELRGFTLTAFRRVALITILCITSSFTLIVVWCHGIAYMDEYRIHGMMAEIGVLTAVRVLAPLLTSKILNYDSCVWLVLGGIVIPMCIHVVLYRRMPEQPLNNARDPQTEQTPQTSQAPPAPEVPQDPQAHQDLYYQQEQMPVNSDRMQMEGRGFIMSLDRVLQNKLVMTQMVAMGFLAASFWGFAYNHGDISKVLYHREVSSDFLDIIADLIRYHVVIVVVLYMETQLAYDPSTDWYDKVLSLKVISSYSVVLMTVYVALVTVFHCPHAPIGGLNGLTFEKPPSTCYYNCPAPPKRIFEPVCLIVSSKTYLTICHAGCLINTPFDGIHDTPTKAIAMQDFLAGFPFNLFDRVYMGACDNSVCATAFELYKLVFCVAIIIVVAAMQIQAFLILRHTDPRDRSVTLGFAGCIVSLLTFVVGHPVYFGISASTCIWFEGEKCLFHNYMFPYLVAGASFVFAFMAAALTIYAWIRMSRQQTTRHVHDESPLQAIQ